MKLLFDQNLSHRLIPSFEQDCPGSQHVRDVDLEKADDEAIWTFARKNNFVILTKDTDFLNRAVLMGHPPKVIQLRLGNCSTERIREVLAEEKEAITRFLQDSTEGILVLD
jgi:predicted nuclease of predicted toxin-antitoxin system